MPRPIWKGHISFGLVNVPITLYPAEQKGDLSFHLVDTRNSARVKYERVNEVTGEEVPWDRIVKGYEYDAGNYVLLSDQELESAAPALTRTIDIEEFVDLSEIDIPYFDKPYYLVPNKGAEKGYVLLREALSRSGKVGIARVVIRSRGNIAALMPSGDALILELLRYQQELRPAADYEFPGRDLRKYKVAAKELELAEKLIDGMTGKWKPDGFRDEYREALLKHIRQRVAEGETEEVGEAEAAPHPSPRTVNFMSVLQRSLSQTPGAGARRRKSTHTRKPARKRAS